jgi:hypothetical protein
MPLRWRREALLRNRMDAAYVDKLDGKITEEFWERKMGDWRLEEQQVKLTLEGLASAKTEDRALSAERTLELANKAYLLVCFAGFVRKGQTAQKATFELLGRYCKCHAYLQISLRSHLQKSQNGEMVGAIGFEPTTPCSRSRCATRLRYAPNLSEFCRRITRRKSAPACGVRPASD